MCVTLPLSLPLPLPPPPPGTIEIDALDSHDGEPWCEPAPLPSPVPPAVLPPTPLSHQPLAPPSPRASRTSSAAAPLQQQPPPPHMVARHDIMDVRIHLPDEVLPPGYIILAQTVGGNKGDLDNKGYFDRGSHGAFICYTRRGPHNHGPGIADLVALAKGESLPVGFDELVETTVGGKPLKEVTLAVRRQRYDARHRYFEDRAVTGLYLVCPAKGESLPGTLHHDEPGLFLDQSSSSSSSSNSNSNGRRRRRGRKGYHLLDESVSFKSTGGSKRLYLAYRKAPCPMGLCEVTFKGEVLDRFPRQDHHDFALPLDVLPMFSYPKGIHIQRVRVDKPPEPSYCSYVLTDEYGRNYYISSITLYEPLSLAMTVQVERAIQKEWMRRGRYKEHLESVLEQSLVDERNANCGQQPRRLLVAPKVLLCVSHWPVFHFQKKWLSQLYMLAMMQNPVPLERCIEHFVRHVPVPEAGGAALSLQLHDMMEPIVLARPRLQGLPFLNLGFDTLFRALDVGNVLTVLALLLHERKILVVAKHESLLTEVMEALRALLFPYKWESCFVPRMTESMLGCVEFPGGFFLGVKDDADDDEADEANHTMLGKVQGLLRDCDDVILVDLSRNLVTSASPRLPVTFKSLPAKLRETLQVRWMLSLAEAELVPGSGFASNPDHDLDFPGMSTATPCHQKRRPLNDRAIRDAALCLMLSLLKGYRDHLVVPELNHGYREIFAKQAFLNQCVDKANRSFMVKMMGTQLFSSFIQRRTEASDPHLLFFDHCMASYTPSPEAWDSVEQKHLLSITGGRGSSSEEEAPAPVPPPPRLLLIDRVESLELAASSSSSRVNSPSLKMMISRASSSVMLSPRAASSSLSSSSLSTSPNSGRLLPAVLHKATSRLASTLSSSSGSGGDDDDMPPSPVLLRGGTSSSSFSPSALPSHAHDHDLALPLPSRPSTEGLPPGELFSYCDHGYLAWPKQLDAKLFAGTKGLHDHDAPTGGDAGAPPRDPSSQFRHLHDGRMAGLLLARTHLELSQDEQDLNSLGNNDGRRGCVYELPKCLARHAYASWFMCLPLLVQSAPEAEKEDLIVRAFGVLAAIQAERQVLPDETIYRALLVAIVRSGDAHCHRSDAVRLLKELTALGVKPNAISYGVYTRAIAEDYARKNTPFLDEELALAPSTLDVVRSKAPGLYLSFLDESRRQHYEKGTRWRRGLAQQQQQQHPQHQPQPQQHRPSHAPSYVPDSPDVQSRPVSLSRSEHRGLAHLRQLSLESVNAANSLPPLSHLPPASVPSHASVTTSWSFALGGESSARLATLQDAQTYAVVAVSNGMACVCGHTMLDEELNASWYIAEGLEGLAMVACPACQMPFHPQLLVRCSSFSKDVLRDTLGSAEAAIVEETCAVVGPGSPSVSAAGLKGLGRRASATGAGDDTDATSTALTVSSALRHDQLHRLVGTLLTKHSAGPAHNSLSALVEGFLATAPTTSSSSAAARTASSSSSSASYEPASLVPGMPAPPSAVTNGTSGSLLRRVEGLLPRKPPFAAARNGHGAVDEDEAAAEKRASRVGKGASHRKVYHVTTQCSYMSPAAMRLGLEHLVQEHGEHALYRETMLELCPDLFYNLWWYSSRFGLPLPLAARPTHEQQHGAAHFLLVGGWDAALVDKGAHAALLVLQAFQEDKMAYRLHDVLEEAAVAAAATLAAAVPGLSSHLSSCSLDALACSTTSQASAASSASASGAVREAELLELLTTQVFQELRGGGSPQHEDGIARVRDVAGLVHAALEEYREDRIGKARDTALGQLQAMVVEGTLTQAITLFLAHRDKGEDADPLFQQSLYRVLFYLASQGTHVPAACPVGSHHKACSASENQDDQDQDQEQAGSFETRFAAACGEAQGHLRLPLDAAPGAGALASRSVFGHLY